MAAQEKILWICFLGLICVQAAIWMGLKQTQAKWINVPPVPTEFSIKSAFLGDDQLAYRSSGIVMQNLGDQGGRVTSLADYNLKDLAGWFNLLHRLDPRSDYIPYIAAFYYGGADVEGEKLAPLVAYLRQAGTTEGGQKWRWLAQAVYIARYKVKDLDYAYEMALELAALADRPNADQPNWTRQMPAFILNEQGEKEAAYAIMLEILKSSADKIHPNEVNHTRAYICETILTPAEAAQNPLCDDVK